LGGFWFLVGYAVTNPPYKLIIRRNSPTKRVYWWVGWFLVFGFWWVFGFGGFLGLVGFWVWWVTLSLTHPTIRQNNLNHH
jgi:hypothetical protein